MLTSTILAGCNFDPVSVRAAGDVAVPLTSVRYATVPDNDRDTTATADNGKHHLTARIDGAGANLEVATASARHSVRGNNPVRFDVAGAQDGAPMAVRFVLRDAEWTLGPVIAQPDPPPPNFAPNADVKAKLYVKVVANEDTVPDLVVLPPGTPNEAVFQGAAGAPISAQAIFAPPVGGKGDLTADLTVISGGVYYVEIVAKAEGKDIPGQTKGYVSAIDVAYDRLEMHKP
jgi:hypothetical protein